MFSRHKNISPHISRRKVRSTPFHPSGKTASAPLLRSFHSKRLRLVSRGFLSRMCGNIFSPKKHFPPWEASQAPYHSLPPLVKAHSFRCSASFPPHPLRWASAGALSGCGEMLSQKNISPHPLRRRMGGSIIDWIVQWTIPLFLKFSPAVGMGKDRCVSAPRFVPIPKTRLARGSFSAF